MPSNSKFAVTTLSRALTVCSDETTDGYGSAALEVFIGVQTHNTDMGMLEQIHTKNCRLQANGGFYGSFNGDVSGGDRAAENQ